MTAIGKQDGIAAFHNRMRDLDPAGTKLVKGADGKWPDMNQALAGIPVDQWKAIDKHQRTEQILKDDHDAGGDAVPPPDPPGGLADAQARMFLAGNPLDCLLAPAYMVPVLTADFGNYRSEGGTDDEILDWLADVAHQLGERFSLVESWADCRNPTSYSDADRIARELYLNGSWGQCEDAMEFDNAIADGATRLVGQLGGLRDDQRNLISASGIHITFELYRNKMPWQVPDYMDCGDGVGGNCIGVYASDSEGAVYTPVSEYKGLGYYVSGRDSVYGVGLQPSDWADL